MIEGQRIGRRRCRDPFSALLPVDFSQENIRNRRTFLAGEDFHLIRHNSPSIGRDTSTDVYWDATQIIQPLAEKSGLTLLEVASRWLVHHIQLKFARGKELAGDGIIVDISSLKQLEDNINPIEGDPLPSDVVDALDAAWKMYSYMNRDSNFLCRASDAP
ncbi:hypothetical protein V1505DRAFT_20891 [Lipomyces doorenjongii]